MRCSLWLTTTLTLGLLTSAVLTGCASVSTRTPTPTESVSREAGLLSLGTNQHLLNSTGEAITVVNVVSDTNQGMGVVEPGGTASAEGSNFGSDVEFNVTFVNGVTMKFRAHNPPYGMGYPVLMGDTCGEVSYHADETRFRSFGEHGITIKRLPDDDWKQFRITFTPTPAESATDWEWCEK